MTDNEFLATVFLGMADNDRNKWVLPIAEKKCFLLLLSNFIKKFSEVTIFAHVGPIWPRNFVSDHYNVFSACYFTPRPNCASSDAVYSVNMVFAYTP